MNEEKSPEPRPDADQTIDLASAAASQREATPAGAHASATGGGGGTTSQDRFSPGQQFGPYRIDRLLGKGGMGEVYEAEQTETGHRVALKVLSGDADWSPARRERFLQEGKLAASISNPHSLYVYGTDEIDGTPVIAMELALGGTLKDRVEAEGPLSITEAVEAALQMLEGLSAAHRAGILHRDVKPANSFVDRDGSVKIGDYGLSLATDDADATRLTMHGTMMGTPAFAPPEQLRGGKVDRRADIYAVGATLYYLLTARVPFTGADALQAVLATLEQPAPNPRAHRPEIPTGLAEVILRCLQKDPSSRFQSCEDLQTALADFGSQAPQRAPAGKRFVAGFLDMALLKILSMGVVALLFPKYLENGPSGARISEVFLAAAALLYPAITEGFFGATLGKALLGLRVSGPGGRAPGFLRALLRSGIFWVLVVVPQVVSAFVFDVKDATSMPVAVTVAFTLIETFGWIWVFLPVLRGNWDRGLHDLWSRTAVFQRSAIGARSVTAASPPPVGTSAPVWSIGPYQVRTDPAGLAPDAIVSGIDPSLRRHVWIRICSATTPAVPSERRALSRPGRLRWLNGRRAPEISWDAFEAIEGTPLLASGRKPWGSVRHWLWDLAHEVAISETEAASLPSISLDRVWLASSGHAVLLEFPAPGAAPDLLLPASPARDPKDPRAVQEFLHEVASAAMGAAPVSATPLPLHASRFLQDLEDRRFDSTQSIADALASIRDREVHLRRSRIALQLALVAGPSLLFAAFIGIITTQTMRSAHALHPNLMRAQWCLKELSEMKDPPTPEQAADKEAMEIYLAGPLRDAIRDTAATMTGSRRLIEKENSRLWAQILASRPEPSTEEASKAESRIVPRMDRELSGLQGGIAFVLAIVLLSATGLFATLFALFLRGGLLLRAFGIAVVRKDGTEIGRGRALARTLLAWSPVLVFWGPCFFKVKLFGRLFFDPYTPVAAIPWLLLLIGAVWAVLRPERGPADRLAGTYLVPK